MPIQSSVISPFNDFSCPQDSEMPSLHGRLPVPFVWLVHHEVCNIREAVLTHCGIGVSGHPRVISHCPLNLCSEGIEFPTIITVGDFQGLRYNGNICRWLWQQIGSLPFLLPPVWVLTHNSPQV